MFFLARKNLLAEKIRLLISVGGVAFSVLLVVVVGGLYRGWESRITDYIESIDADLWVGQEGSGDMSHSFSVIPSSLGAEIGHTVDIAGVPLENKGIPTGGNLLVYSFAYVTVKDARLIFQLGDATNYFLVKTSQPLAVKDGIEDKFPQLAAFTKDEEIY